MSAVQITLDAVNVQLGAQQALKGVSLRIAAGERVALVGANGSGKSTLLRNMIGLIEPVEGEIFYEKANFTRSDAEERRSFFRRFGVLYQSGGLWSSLTLAENVALPLETVMQCSAIHSTICSAFHTSCNTAVAPSCIGSRTPFKKPVWCAMVEAM